MFCIVILSLFQTGFENFDHTTTSLDACTGNPVISGPTASSITSTGANLGGNITNAGSGSGCNLTERGIAYSTVSGEPVTLTAPATVVNEVTSSTGVFTEPTGVLTPATQYFYVAYARNSNGTSITSEASFFTLSTEPSNHVTNFLVNSVTSNSIQLTWTDASGATPPTNYLIVAKNSSGTFASIVDGTPVADDSDFSNNNGAQNITQGTGSVTFSSLSPETYTFEIYPYTGSASTINFKTAATVPSASATVYAPEPTNHVTSFMVNSVTSNSIQLTWVDATGGTTPSSYVIVARNASGTFATIADGTPVADDTNFGDNNGAKNIAQGTGSVTFSSLTPNTYSFEIYPYNGSASFINFKTDGTVPSASATILASEPANHVTSFAVNTVTSSSIKLTWTDATGSPSASNYLIVARNSSGTFPGVVDGTFVSDDTDFSDNNGALNIGPGTEQVTFSSLAQDTYFFEIYSYRGTGASVNYKTSATVPNASATILASEPTNHVTGFAINTITANSIQLTWTDATGAIVPTNYVIVAKNSSGSFASVADGSPVADDTDFSNNNGALNVAAGAESVTFTLSPATNYTFEIYPYRGSGAAINFKTNGTVPSASGRTLSLEPAAHPANFSAVASSTTQINLVFSAANTITNAAGYIILRRTDGADPTTSGVTDGIAPGSLSLPGGTTLVTTITNTSTTTFNNTGLSAGTQYNYAIIPYNWNGSNTSTYNYLTSPTVLTDFDTPSNGVSITPASSTSVCSGSQVTLTDITIAEVGKGDFSTGGTIFYELNDLAFSFVPTQGSISTSPSIGSATDITSISMVVNASRITITYALDGNNNKKESIILSGIKVTYDGSVAPNAQIVRTGGTATVNGIGSANLGTINSGSPAPAPVVSFSPTAYCQGDVISPGPNVTSNNTNVKWYTDAALTNEIVILAGVTNINTPTLLSQLGFVTTNSGTITRYVTQQPGTCKSAGTPITLTVQPKPVADLIISSGSNTLCRNWLNGSYVNQSVTFTASPSGAASYDFKVNNVTQQNTSSNTYTTNAGALTTGDQVKVIVNVAGSCPSTSNIITMTVNSASPVDFVITNPPPNTPNTTTTFSNQQSAVNLTGTPSGGVFSGEGMVGSNFNPSILPLSPPSYPVSYTVTTAGCTGTLTKNFEVYDGSSAITGLGSDYCSDDAAITMAINSRPGYNLVYIYSPTNYSSNFLPAGSITDLNNVDATSPNYPTWLPPGSPYFGAGGAPYYIRPVNISGFSAGDVTIQFYAAYDLLPADGFVDEVRVQNVTFHKKPIPPSYSLLPNFCTADDILNNVVPMTSATGSTLRWYSNPGLTTEITGSIADPKAPKFFELGVSNGVVQTYNRYVTQTLNGCTSLVRTVTINVVANPSNPNVPAPNPNFCAGAVFNPIIVNAIGGATVRWYKDSGLTTENTPITTPTSVDISELGINNINSTASPIVYTRYVTQTLNGCQSTPTTVTVTINPIPSNPPVVNANPSFCKNQDINSSPPITVTSGSNIRWYRDSGLSNQITPISNQFAATSVELGLDSSVPGTTNFYITQTVNGCESQPTLVSVTINDLATVSISIVGGQSLNSVCKTGSTIKLEASPGAGVWSGPAAAGLINIVAGTNPPAPATGTPSTAELDPSNSNLLPGQNYNLTYTSSGGCANFDTKLVTILPSINPSLVIGDACAGTFVDINNTSVIVPGGATIDQIGYQFGDNGSIPPGIGAIPTGSDGGKTTGSYDNPQHRYSNIGLFPITYTMTTSDGCVVVGNRNVQVSEVPQVNFSWRNACLGGSMEFMANISNGVTIPPGNFTWDFAKNNQLTFSAAGSGGTPNVNYDITGTDIVELIVKSAANCKDTIQKQVFVVPVTTAVTTNTPYSEDFNSDNGGWTSGGINSSWQYGTPSSIVINRDSSATGTGGAWKTNLTGNNNANERSFVISPCFDFSAASKPVISLDIWSNTPRGVDGAVLQYNISGNLENESNWIVVGQVGSGINWYDQNNISSKPGNQASIDAGWTGDENSTTKYKSWKRATFSLDAIVGEPQVNFRIAFAATVSGGEGFAFDNFLIGERTRTVLIENFTNSSSKAGQVAKLQNDKFNTFKSSSTELVKIQYHTSFPGDDPINKQNKDIYNARSAFYGLTSAPAARLDGLFRDGPFTTWGEPFYDDRVLDPTFLRIESIDAQKENGVVKINTKLLATGPIPKNLFVHTVIVEKEITDPSLLGQNGDSEFLYVVRKMLPSPEGHKITTALDAGQTYDVPEVIWDSENLSTPGSGAIVVFVQQDTITSKAVYQSKIIMNPPQPDLVTGIGETSTNLDKIVVYPNPVDGEITIQLPSAAIENTPIKLLDQVGKLIHNTAIPAGQISKTISTQDLGGGVYLLQIESGKGLLIRKKVMVVHNK